MKTKSDLQFVHKTTINTFEKDGAKSFKQAGTTIQRKPNNPDGVPTISLLTHLPGSTYWQRA